jgi:group I intron endonuclease
MNSFNSMLQAGVYQIRCLVNDRIYIGSTRQFKNRWRAHRESLNKNKHSNRPLQHAWNKHGEQSFVFEILEIAPVGDVLSCEQRHLDLRQPYQDRGYNVLKIAGSPRGWKHTSESKAKLAAALRGRPKSKETCAKIKAAKAFTSESTRAKMRASGLAKTQSAEVRAKLSAAQKGKRQSLETRRKISIGLQGRVVAADTRAKLSAAFTGRPKSLEHRKRLSEAFKGRKYDAEAKAKMRAGWTAEARAKIAISNARRKRCRPSKHQLELFGT